MSSSKWLITSALKSQTSGSQLEVILPAREHGAAPVDISGYHKLGDALGIEEVEARGFVRHMMLPVTAPPQERNYQS